MFGDKWAVCTKCEKRFVFRIREQRALSKKGQPIEPPKLCPLCRLGQPAQGRRSGRVKWYSPRRGYGLILDADGCELLFHQDAMRWEGPVHLAEGRQVTYEVKRTPRGSKAIAIQQATATTSY